MTFANVVSLIALFFAVGGAAYAVTIAPKNSVVSKSIKDGQVKRADLANSALAGLAPFDAAQVKRAVVADDPADGGIPTETANLIGNGTFAVHGQCLDNLGSRNAEVRLTTQEGNSYVIERTPAGNETVTTPFNTDLGLVGPSSNAAAAEMADFAAVSPSGAVLHATVTAAVNVQGNDCVFTATGAGT